MEYIIKKVKKNIKLAHDKKAMHIIEELSKNFMSLIKHLLEFNLIKSSLEFEKWRMLDSRYYGPLDVLKKIGPLA